MQRSPTGRPWHKQDVKIAANRTVYPIGSAQNPMKTGTSCSERPKTGEILKSTPTLGPKNPRKLVHFAAKGEKLGKN